MVRRCVGVILLRSGIGAVALEAERIALGAQQMIVVAAVRRVAGGAALRKGGLMVHGLLAQIVDVGVAAEADADGVGLRQAGLVAGVRAVAVGAVARRAGMRHLGRVDQLGLVVVAGDAERLGVGLRQHDLSVFCRRVAGIAALRLERRMLELRHQLGRVRLMRIVALEAVGRGEGLVVVGLLQVCILGIVAIEAERRRGLGQMEAVFRGWLGAGFVGDVAGVAAHIERGVAASFLRDIQAGLRGN